MPANVRSEAKVNFTPKSILICGLRWGNVFYRKLSQSYPDTILILAGIGKLKVSNDSLAL